MTNITKAVHELESEHGPIKMIPEPIMRKWRRNNSDLFHGMVDTEDEIIDEDDELSEKTIGIRKKVARTTAENDRVKDFLDEHSPKAVVRGSSDDVVMTYSRPMAAVIQYIGKRTNRDIARIVNLPTAEVNQIIERLKHLKYYFITENGKVYESDSLIDLKNQIKKDGYDFAIGGFADRLRRGGYCSKGKKTFGKFIKQLVIRKLQIVDNDNNIIKEV